MTTKKNWYFVSLQLGKLLLFLLFPIYLFSESLDLLETQRSICLVKNIFGVDCWGCGITKAIIASVQFDFVRAFHYNELIVIIYPLLIYLWLKGIIKTISYIIKETSCFK